MIVSSTHNPHRQRPSWKRRLQRERRVVVRITAVGAPVALVDRRDQAILYGLGLGPALFPLALVIAVLLRPSRAKLAYALAYFSLSFGLFAHLNRAYLRGAVPPRGAVWVPVIQVGFPLQLLVALLSPQQINWRGHLIRAERGGALRFVRRRSSQSVTTQ